MHRLRTIGEWTVLLPLWRRLFKSRGWQIGASVATGFTWLLIIVGVAAGGGGDDTDDEATRAEATRTTSATRTRSPALTRQATAAPTAPPTPAPTPPPTPPATPEPIILTGFGQTATEAVTPTCPICRATFTHDGVSNFIVHTFRGAEEDYLINDIGVYQGSRPLFGEEPIVFDIDADGAWSIRIEWIGAGGQPAFSGRGDAVSDLFDPPAVGPWEFAHDGQSNFIVWYHCSGGSDGIQNEIGQVSASGVVAFEDGPCLWEVEADGNWSLTPR